MYNFAAEESNAINSLLVWREEVVTYIKYPTVDMPMNVFPWFICLLNCLGRATSHRNAWGNVNITQDSLIIFLDITQKMTRFRKKTDKIGNVSFPTVAIYRLQGKCGLQTSCCFRQHYCFCTQIANKYS